MNDLSACGILFGSRNLLLIINIYDSKSYSTLQPQQKKDDEKKVQYVKEKQ